MTVERGASARLAASMAPGVVRPDAAERPITVDQTNESVVVGEAIVVKWLTPPVPQPHPAERLLAHLTEVGFDDMPAFVGVHVEDEDVLALLTRFVPDALDGWDWFVDDLTAALEAADVDAPLRWAARVGRLAGRLHLALATASAVLPDPVGREPIAGEAARGRALLAEALACTTGDEGDRLAARAAMVTAAIDALDDVGDVDVQAVHGDLHVGQLLRAGDSLYVNDFDGSPVADESERRADRSPMVDLASLLQSIDHVGRIVVKRLPQHSAAIEHFIAAAIATCATTYAAVRPIRADEAVLLGALRAIQELHEFVYAARSLPLWLYVPDAALAAMFPLR